MKGDGNVHNEGTQKQKTSFMLREEGKISITMDNNLKNKGKNIAM